LKKDTLKIEELEPTLIFFFSPAGEALPPPGAIAQSQSRVHPSDFSALGVPAQSRLLV
jgi:hypothetical protein